MREFVENYRFEAEGPHDAEEFVVNGVRFSYITDGTAWFYSKPASRGGVIYGNGQYVEIRYLADTDADCVSFSRLSYPLCKRKSKMISRFLEPYAPG